LEQELSSWQRDKQRLEQENSSLQKDKQRVEQANSFLQLEKQRLEITNSALQQDNKRLEQMINMFQQRPHLEAERPFAPSLSGIYPTILMNYPGLNQMVYTPNPNPEKVVKLSFSQANNLIEEPITITVEPHPFGKGTHRQAYKFKIAQHPGDFVLKIRMAQVPIAAILQDDRTQKRAEYWANLWNARTSQKINFVSTFLLLFSERGNLVCNAEPFINGNYCKHNNNFGAVIPNESNPARYTPHAFSHFTYEASNGEEMVVDIQGSGNLYTDPQIHSQMRGKYGQGDLGADGMTTFFNTHICSQMCKELNLKPQRNGILFNNGRTHCF